MTTIEHTWIDTDEALADFGRLLARSDAIALDTESDGFHHYFDKLCLLQFSTREAHYLVDPLAVSTLEPLRQALADPAIPVVMHAAEQDIMYLRRDHGLEVRGLFDTSVAAQFCGHTRLGLAALLEAYFDLHLSKSNQRDDWSVRPLNASQLNYAIADTSHLLALADRLKEEVHKKGRTSWAREEYQALEQRQINLSPSQPDDITRVKGWKPLPPRGRAILRELLRSRDGEARRRDRPAFRIASGALLLDLAMRPPADVKELVQRKGFPRQRSDKLGQILMQAVQRGQILPESDFPVLKSRTPTPQDRPRRDPAFEARVNRLRSWRQKKAVELGLEPGVIISQRGLEAIAATPPGSPGEEQLKSEMRHWRWHEFADQWRALMENRDGQSADAPAPEKEHSSDA